MAMEIDTENVLIILRDEINAVDSELAANFYTLEDLYERKLWYQLSEVLKNIIFKNPNSKSIRLKLFDNFILTFSDKINQLLLVEFLVISLSESTPQDSFEYLTNLKQKIIKLGEKKSHNSADDDINDYEIIQALIYLENELARVKLQLGFIDEAGSIIDQSQEKIDHLSISADNRVNASFYRIKAQLMKVKGDFNSFYYNSLLFLACIPQLADLEDKESIVEDICISGLLGDKIFNFGEIIMHEIFTYLQNDWLKKLFLSLNNGDLKSFNQLIVDSSQLNHYSDISNRIDFLKQKICIMAFIELVFNKPTTSRCIQYKEISTNIPLLKSDDEIEHLVMRCLSLGLIKGLINQVEGNIEVSWIQPRTMTLAQIESMKNKMEVWNDKVASLNNYMDISGGELFV
jgi:26S proteasome regulatory subunit N9